MSKKPCWRILKPTKFIFSLVIGALFIAGLFLFLRNENEDVIATLKPSKFNFSESNILPSQPLVEIKADSVPESKMQNQIENLQPQEQSQWVAFESILKTKNDNDPRLDQELKKLSPAFKQLLYKKYDLLPPEDHTGRGLIVYLVARDISSLNDFQFLQKIYQESPCLSMTDCKSAANDNDPHHSSMDQTTLIYQQLSVLYLIEKQLAQNPALLKDASSRSGIVQVLTQAEAYPVPAVYEKARSIRIKYGL